MSGSWVDGATLDRIDNNGHYSCGKHDECSDCRENRWSANVRWANAHVQATNRRNNILVEYEGVTKCAEVWGREVGIRGGTIRNRIKRGWSVKAALFTKVS